LGVVHWFWRNVGWFAAVDGLVLPTSIAVNVEGAEVARLGAPAASFNLGLAARYEAQPTSE
jgi:hypothetical protein